MGELVHMLNTDFGPPFTGEDVVHARLVHLTPDGEMTDEAVEGGKCRIELRIGRHDVGIDSDLTKSEARGPDLRSDMVDFSGTQMWRELVWTCTPPHCKGELAQETKTAPPESPPARRKSRAR